MNWISIEEELPELDQEVLLFDDWEGSDKKRRADVRVGYLSEFTTRKGSSGISHSLEWSGACEYYFNITHWMPLPKPPKSYQI